MSAAVLVATRPRVSFASDVKAHNYVSTHRSPLAISTVGPTVPSSNKPRRPQHKRSRSSSGYFDSLEEIRKCFNRALSGSPARAKAVARDFYACSVGLRAAFKIRDFTLAFPSVQHLVAELSKIISTDNLFILLDEHNKTFYGIHTQLLNQRFDTWDCTTCFLQIDCGIPRVIDAHQLGFMKTAITCLKDLLHRSAQQVCSTSIFNWSLLDVTYRMLTLGDWLLDQPVCYVVQPGIGQGSALSQLICPSQSCWTMRCSAEGVDPVNDHHFEACQFPVNLFEHDMAGGEKSPLLDGASSMNLIQDRVQSTMFERLNGNDMAAAIWSEISCNTEGPSAFV